MGRGPPLVLGQNGAPGLFIYFSFFLLFPFSVFFFFHRFCFLNSNDFKPTL
jgi:hypothetical protein